MATYISHSPDETRALGEKWGRAAKEGWVLGLSGDLGSGKTQLVKGIASGLGCPARVHSPTYALLNEYSGGRLPLIHIDLYRLNGRSDVIGAGLEEYLTRPSGVTVVEWIERWTAGQVPEAHIQQIVFEHISEFERKITYDNSLA
jgi:tRNA threonylcarbamoyladenosine biosynthesis protein TsaE